MLDPAIRKLLRDDRRYPWEAYVFVFEALNYAQNVLGFGVEAASEPLAPSLQEREEEEKGAGPCALPPVPGSKANVPPAPPPPAASPTAKTEVENQAQDPKDVTKKKVEEKVEKKVEKKDTPESPTPPPSPPPPPSRVPRLSGVR